MPEYQKAYRLADLRRYEGWPPEAGTALAGDSVVFLREDLTVTASCMDDREVLFRDGGEAWARFCRERLSFSAPDWDAEAALVRRALQAG